MKRIIAMCSVLAVAATLSGCFTPSGLNSTEQQTYVGDMVDSTLKELYKYQPETEEIVKNSKGYVIFNTYAIDYAFITTENGWGVAVNNETGKKTYLKDLAIGLGPALGFAIMRNILVFDNQIEFNEFVAGGWGINLKASAVARFSDDGNWDVAGASSLTSGARAYKIAHRGLLAEASIDVSKSWQNHSLTEK
jgi:lipid-binding SYLF domain-containing protein